MWNNNAVFNFNVGFISDFTTDVHIKTVYQHNKFIYWQSQNTIQIYNRESH